LSLIITGDFSQIKMRFEKDFPDKLRSQILVSEVIGKKVKLKLRGKEFTGLCPFHNEKSPSFTVNDLKGFYHCFGCQAHGDIITFTMQSEGLEFIDAIKKLADDHGIMIPQVKFDIVHEEKVDRDYLILEKIGAFFEKTLQESTGREARAYIAKRGLSVEITKKFRLGYALSSYDALHKFLAAAGFAEAEILRSGVIAKNDQQKIYDKFRHRIIFPITDKKNRIIAFGGRVLAAEDMPKYLNSAETEIFKKNQTLYNIFNARKPIFEKKYAVVVEGYMDVISLVSSGIENVVAGLGTALGENHLRELFNITDKIVICLDGDSAGLRAAKRVAEIALPIISSKKNISFTFLPNQMDPDDFVKSFGAAKLEENFMNSTNLSQALIEFTLLDLGLEKKTEISAEDKAKLEAELTKKVEVIADATTKKYFSQFCRDALFSLGRASFNKSRSGFKDRKNVGQNSQYSSQNYSQSFGKNSSQNSAQNLSHLSGTSQNFGNLIQTIYAKPSNAADYLAKNIIALIIKYPQLAHHKDENFDIKEVNFLSDKLTIIKDLAVELVDENESITSEILLSGLENASLEGNFDEIKNLLATMSSLDLQYEESGIAQISQKMSLLLLKELLLQVDQQYKQSLLKIDEIETYQTTIVNEKIKEIFSYRNLLEQKILELERDLIS